MKDYQIHIYNNEQVIENNQLIQSIKLIPSQTLFNNFALQQIKSLAQCFGKAQCGACKIKILSSSSPCSPINLDEKNQLSQDQLNNGWRLACQVYSLRSISIYLPHI